MKALSTYRVNQPTTTSGHSISITTTIFGTEEEIEYVKKNCAETIGSGLMLEYGSPLTSQFSLLNQDKDVNPEELRKTIGKIVPDVRDGLRYEDGI